MKLSNFIQFGRREDSCMYNIQSVSVRNCEKESQLI